MSLNTYFDKIFCINLDDRPDRWAHCLSEFKQWDIGPVERVPGFRTPDRHGHAGCTRSHRQLMQRIADGPWERVLILEDDFHVLTLDDFYDSKFKVDDDPVKTFIRGGRGSFNDRFDRMIKHVPSDWDLLYLGAGYREAPQYRVNEFVIRTNAMLTTSSVAITKAFAPTWIENSNRICGPIEHNATHQIDHLYADLCKERKFYVFQPRLMIQRRSKSDITEREEYYMLSMTDPVHEGLV